MARAKKEEGKAKETEKDPASAISLETLCVWVEESAEATKDARALSERDRDYYDNKQWTPEEVATLEQRGQAPIVKNRIKPKIDYLIGLEQQKRTDPKALPRKPQLEQEAHAVTDALRFVADDNQFDQKRSDVFKEVAIEGAGGVIVEAVRDASQGGYRIVVRRIAWDRMIVDHRSRDPDFNDGRFKGIYLWLDLEEAQRRYPEKKDELVAAFNSAGSPFDATHEDKPNYWFDRKRKRIRLVELYYLEGPQWMYCVFTQGTEVVERAPSSYQDDRGLLTCPIEFISCHIDRQNNRYGVGRQLIGPQDEVNKRSSKALHLLNSRQTMGSKGAITDPDELAAQKAKPDGHIEVNPGYLERGEFQFTNTQDMAQGNLVMLQEAKQEIDAVGANASLTGKDPRALSGIAQEQRAQAGSVEVGPIFDRLKLWQNNVYRQMFARMKQYWTDETYVRVTDEEDAIKFIALNQRFPVQQADGSIAWDVRNKLSDMDMDLVVEDAPNTATLQSEQFGMIVDAYKANPQAIPFDMVIEASDIRNKQKLLDRMRGKTDDPNQNPLMPALQQLQQQLAQCQAQLQQEQAGNAVKQAENVVKLKELEVRGAENQVEAQKVALEAQSMNVQTMTTDHQGIALQGFQEAVAGVAAAAQSLAAVGQAAAAIVASQQQTNETLSALVQSNVAVAQTVAALASPKVKVANVTRVEGGYQVVAEERPATVQ